MRRLPVGKPLCVLETGYLHQEEISKLLPNKLVSMCATVWCQLRILAWKCEMLRFYPKFTKKPEYSNST